MCLQALVEPRGLIQLHIYSNIVPEVFYRTWRYSQITAQSTCAYCLTFTTPFTNSIMDRKIGTGQNYPHFFDAAIIRIIAASGSDSVTFSPHAHPSFRVFF